MNRYLLATIAIVALPLGSCASYGDDSDTLARAGTGAAVGAAAGAGAGALVGGLGVLEGAAIGAAVGGLAGAVWADADKDGRADGYVYENQYYQGEPANYAAHRCKSVAGTALKTGAAGAVVGAGAGALIGGLGVLEGAAIGAAVGGLGGAVWADADNDGCVDGYVREGQYYQGAPVVQPTGTTNTSYVGERG